MEHCLWKSDKDGKNHESVLDFPFVLDSKNLPQGLYSDWSILIIPDIAWCETSDDKFSVTSQKFIDTALIKTSKIKEQDMVSLII